jgi:hypothetical protein
MWLVIVIGLLLIYFVEKCQTKPIKKEKENETEIKKIEIIEVDTPDIAGAIRDLDL